MKKQIYFFSLLIIATIIILFDNTISYKKAYDAAEDYTKLQALGIAVSLEAVLMNLKPKELTKGSEIFRDIINEGKWEGIAFIALYDRTGVTILHSNKNLIGRTVTDSLLSEMADTELIKYGYLTLGTGERVFTINMAIHLQGFERPPVLRVALHTLEMQRIRGGAMVKVSAMTVVLIILWLFGILLWRAIRRMDRLRDDLAERERLALIGQMATVLAHEIRNPLGSIKGFAQYLLENANETDFKEALTVIVNESSRLESLTNDLLTYARPSELRITLVDVDATIEDVVKAMKMEHPLVDFNIVTMSNKKIHSDGDKIKQALINLLDNAVDAVNHQGLITIKSTPVKDGIVLSIKDNGIGIDEGIAKEVFKPFFTTKTRGTGLGLAIVKGIAELLGGSIEFQSTKGEGTEFVWFIRDNPDPHSTVKSKWTNEQRKLQNTGR